MIKHNKDSLDKSVPEDSCKYLSGGWDGIEYGRSRQYLILIFNNVGNNVGVKILGSGAGSFFCYHHVLGQLNLSIPLVF